MNIGYLIYEAERPKGVAERRAADAQAGELAASIARLGRSLKDTVARAAGMGRARHSGDMSVADLERLYATPSGHAALDSHGAGCECALRS